jgi:hypothetical protein
MTIERLTEIARGGFVTPAKYLQVAMLNLMRTRFLGWTSGILSVDIDEFVRPMPSSGPVFAFTRTSATLYWQFQATTTGWKALRFETGIVGSPDHDLAQALQDLLLSL